MTYQTNNPVGSVDVRDLYDNAEAFDNFSAGPLDAYPDRFGVSRQSLAGMSSEFSTDQSDRDAQWNAFLIASGYQVLGPYAAGLNFTALNQVFSYDAGSGAEFYAPGPSIALPYTTTGAGAGEIANFRSVGDATLRSDMANSADPAKGAALVGFSSETVYSALTRALASNTLDTTRIDVPSAATVNLTNSAPNTRHINITGTTGITSFTVAAGRCYFVRFAGTLTLTNNASIVTQSGANITTAQGDTCILRATSANVVEVLAYTPARNQAVGYEQTWQDVVGSRALNTVYTNSTGKPIQIKVSAICSTLAVMQIFINGAGTGLPGVAANLPESSAIIPNGATYRALNSSGTASQLNWWELR